MSEKRISFSDSLTMKRTYTDEQKAEALAVLKANGGNLTRTAGATGIPRKTLAEWSKGNHVSDAAEALIPQKVDELADKLEKIAHLISDSLPEKIEKAGLRDASVSLGVVIDKRNLLIGKPTSISESRSDKARYETAIQQLIDEMKRLGEKIDRPEAIRLLQPHLPEINQYVN